MKKVVITFGLISGILCSTMMIATLPFLDIIGDKGEIFGYTALVLSFLLVYFGIRSYRDNVAGGMITFGKAFTIGILITLISSCFYVVTWEIVYFNFMHGSMDKYFAHLVEQAQAAGGTPEAIQRQVASVNHMKDLYQNPLYNAAFTFIEPFPVGLIMTVLSAAVLRRKPAQLSQETVS